MAKLVTSFWFVRFDQKGGPVSSTGGTGVPGIHGRQTPPLEQLLLPVSLCGKPGSPPVGLNRFQSPGQPSG